MNTQLKTVRSASEIRRFCTFFVGPRQFGVTITDVKEIQPPPGFTPVFHAAEEVKGLVNIRGQIHLVIDLRRLFGMEGAHATRKNRIVLFKPHVGESFGVLVDDVGDVVEMPAAQIENLGDKNPDAAKEDMEELSGLIAGVCKLKERLLVILDTPRLLEKIQMKHQG